MAKLRLLRNLVFLVVFLFPFFMASFRARSSYAAEVISAPNAATTAESEWLSMSCPGSYECVWSCWGQGCCDYCKYGGVDVAFYCTVPCVLYLELCCY